MSEPRGVSKVYLGPSLDQYFFPKPVIDLGTRPFAALQHLALFPLTPPHQNVQLVGWPAVYWAKLMGAYKKEVKLDVRHTHDFSFDRIPDEVLLGIIGLAEKRSEGDPEDKA